MYRILIVDDEITIIEGLKMLIDWEAIGLTIINQVYNAEAAIELLRNESFDIIIVDIKMPGMDGLQLIKKIRSMDNYSKIVILSGYDYFAYAQQALELDVVHYFLKPIDEDELNLVMRNLVEKLDKENRQRVNNALAMEALHKDILYHWITGKIKKPNIYEIEKMLNIKLDYQYFLVCALSLANIDNTSIEYDLNSLAANHKTLLNDNIHNIKIGCPNGDIAIVYCSNLDIIRTEDIKSELQIMLNNANEAKNRLFFTIGSIVQGCDNVVYSYLNAIDLFKYKLSLPNGSIDTYGMGTKPVTVHLPETSPFIKRIIDYIHNDCSNVISLKTISAIFNINPAYLGQVFKSETGFFFNDYINLVRIEKVKELVCFTNLSRNQIAAKAGFISPEYMNKVFKKITGMTISEYNHLKRIL